MFIARATSKSILVLFIPFLSFSQSLIEDPNQAPKNLNGIKSAEMVKAEDSEFRTEFSKFCTTFRKKYSLDLAKPVNLTDAGVAVDMTAASKKQKLTFTTPCGTIATELKQEFNKNFPDAIREFCTDMKAKYPGQQPKDGPIVFGSVKLPPELQQTDSCILGNVELSRSHRLQNAVIIGTGEISPLKVATPTSSDETFTWSGIYFGQGSLTQNPKQKIEAGMSGGVEGARDRIIELSNFSRLEFRNPGTGVQLPAPASGQ